MRQWITDIMGALWAPPPPRRFLFMGRWYRLTSTGLRGGDGAPERMTFTYHPEKKVTP